MNTEAIGETVRHLPYALVLAIRVISLIVSSAVVSPKMALAAGVFMSLELTLRGLSVRLIISRDEKKREMLLKSNSSEESGNA